MFSSFITAISSYASFLGNWTKCVNVTQVEADTKEVQRYYVEVDSTFTAGVPRYFVFKMPTTADAKIVELHLRNFKTYDSAADLKILWNSTGIVEGTQFNTWNENRITTGLPNQSALEVFEVTVTGDGDLRESDFAGSGGNPISSSGGISADNGHRIYSPDSNFVLKVTSPATQRVHVQYSFVEKPAAFYKL